MARQDEMLERLKNVKEHMKSMNGEIEQTKTILKAFAKKNGMDYDDLLEWIS